MKARYPASAAVRGQAAAGRSGRCKLAWEAAQVLRQVGQIEASAESATYQPFRFHPDDTDMTILGRAIWAGRDL